MILDSRNVFASATSAILNNTNAKIGDVFSRGADVNTLVDLGAGETVYFVVQVTTAFVGGTSAQFDLVSDSEEPLTTSKTTHCTTGAIGVSTLVAGYTKAIPLPPDKTYELYLGAWETTVGNVTGGAVNIFLSKDIRRWRPYVDAVN